MKKNLTKNIPLKIMSVVVGVLVWLIVVNVDNPIVTKGFVITDVQIINEAYVDQLGRKQPCGCFLDKICRLWYSPSFCFVLA